MKNKMYLGSILTALIFCLLSSAVTAQLTTNNGVLHFNSSAQPSQKLIGNNGAQLAYFSKHSAVSHLSIFDNENKLYGRLYGNANGANFGLLDGDGNWSYLAAKDNYTAFRINNSEKMRIQSNGYVGIGTIAPTQALEVNGNIELPDGNYNSTQGSIYLGGVTDQQETGMRLFGGEVINSDYFGGYIDVVVPDGADDKGLRFRIDQDNGVDEKMRIRSDGKVVIGTVSELVTPGDYKLYVEGGVLAEKVKVATVDYWADYVFAEDYELNTIEDVESFIEENKHLPNVPSTKEVSENGIDMAEMDATLLRQIEELWLHIIEIKKENKQQASSATKDIEEIDTNTRVLNISVLNQIEELQSQITELTKHVTELEIQLGQK